MADDREKYYVISLVLNLIPIGFVLTRLIWYAALIWFVVWILYVVKRESGYYLSLLANSILAISLVYLVINYFVTTKGFDNPTSGYYMATLYFFAPFIVTSIISILTIYKSKPFISKDWKKTA